MSAVRQRGVSTVACIPAYSEEHNIGLTVQKTRKYVDRVVVIDDGSQDRTAEAAKAAQAQVIKHKTNRGYGEAIKSCFETARASDAEVMVILDGDGQHNPDETPQLLASIQAGADLVIGSRFLANKNKIPGYRRFGIGFITSLWNFGSRIHVSDSQSGFRAYHRRLFENLTLTEKGMSVSIEIIEKARRQGAVIAEVPISCRYPVSRMNLPAIKHGLSVALSVVRVRLKNTRGGIKNEDSGRAGHTA